MGVVEGPAAVRSADTVDIRPSADVQSSAEDPTQLPRPADDDDGGGDVRTIEEARTVIKQLRDRCRFQTHQALLWRKKAKSQVP